LSIASYDLRSEPWIPVLIGQKLTRVGLTELFSRAHEITDLAVPVPPAAAGLWRILYAITARITGLDQRSRWGERQCDVLDLGRFNPDAIRSYLNERCDGRFDLFDPVWPWLQDPRLREQCGSKASGINKLVFDRPSGNNQVWFGHYTDTKPVPLPVEEAAWYLIAQLYYGASGRCSSREVGGAKYADTKAGPLRSAMSYHPIGENLFVSLVIGVPRPPSHDEGEDRCPWELDQLPDPLGPPPQPTWPGGFLTRRSQHAVLLVPSGNGRHVEDAYLTWAWRHLPPGGGADPYVIMQRKRDGSFRYFPAEGDRALWRDFDALLAENSDDRHRPAIMTNAADLHPDGDLRIRAYGFDQDGQAKDRQWFTAVTPPILGLLCADETVHRGVSRVREAAETIARRLTEALDEAWKQVGGASGGKNGGKKDRLWTRHGSTYYWSRAEPIFWHHVNTHTYDEADRKFRILAHEAIDHALGAALHRPRVAKAAVGAHSRISAVPAKTVGTGRKSA
jgi:CRISPR system Cascade subunit CasA